jgi:hypothetical protein
MLLSDLLATDDYRYFWTNNYKHYEIPKDLIIKYFASYPIKVKENNIIYGPWVYKKGEKIVIREDYDIHYPISYIEETILTDDNKKLLDILIPMEYIIDDPTKYYHRDHLMKMILKTQELLLISKYQTDNITKVIDMIEISKELKLPFEIVYRKNLFHQIESESEFKTQCQFSLIINYFKQIPTDNTEWFCFHHDPKAAFYESDSYDEINPSMADELKFSIQSLRIALVMMKGVIDSNLLENNKSFVEYYDLGCRLLNVVSI